MTEGWAIWVAGVVIVLIFGAFAFTLKVRQDGSKNNSELHKRIDKEAKEFADYKVRASERFASIEYLKDVENRVTSSIKHLETSLTTQLMGVREDLRAVLQHHLHRGDKQ